MPDAPNASASLRFSDDLRRIREDRGVTLDALHEETKIPLGLLEQFEQTGLFDHPMFNRVYLRSLVRAYAGIVGISTDTALEALDEALAGTYRDLLVVTYLGQAPEAGAREEPVEAETPPAGEAPEQASPEEPAAEEKAVPAGKEVVSAGERAASAGKKAASGEGKATPDKARKPDPRPQARRERTSMPPAASPPAMPSWESQSPPPPVRRTKPVDVKQRAWYNHWLVIGAAVILLVGSIWVVLALLERPVADEAEQQAVAIDTSAADSAVAPPPPARPRIVPGDTLHFVVVAASGKVERIRITRDDDLRRPYWIEQGEARAFPVLERIVLEDRLELIRLLVEGYEYPVDRRDEAGRLVVTRENVRAFLDTVSGPPVDLPAELEALRNPATG